jgi:mannitol PTS system EIIA component
MNPPILSEEKIRLGVICATKWDAINAAGDLLVAAGHVSAGYPALMAARERVGTTYLGNGIAVPHGTREAKALVRTAGISFIQLLDGVDFGGGNIARLVLGLAAADDTHLDLLTHIAMVCTDDAHLTALLHATSPAEVMAILAPGTP